METHSPCGYLYHFLQSVANEAGRDKWLSVVKKVLTPAERLCLIDDNPRCPIVGYWGTKTSSLFQQKKTQLVKATLGITRDRKLLQSHFACCDRLWT